MAVRFVVAGISMLLLAGCTGQGSSTENMDTPGHTLAARSPQALLRIGTTSRGTALTDETGTALYLFAADRGRSSGCTGTCLAMWPPYLTRGAPRAASGARSDLLGTVQRPDGTTQVTYAGHPLYRYKKDYYTGDARGQRLYDFGGLWYLLGASGAPL
ncbi:COG4315 family predicted lipoprotein [Actinomadura rupiterrae]|uniref:COG4315 family predicted lipoprotein n=1 Tax=Actinomadura rupiterrae TaxID=559627 RepID=UPI0020A508C6|nr:hypothetical protein [Actinomadura rupiterrae]MCP2336371.1 putative lipoprotein with Yx(FWY)xxD motif [Actinomadura rupiterrae]